MNIQNLLALLVKLVDLNIGEDELWEWEDSIFGGPTNPIIKYPKIDWKAIKLDQSELEQVKSMALLMAGSNVAGQVNDDGVLMCLSPEKRTQIMEAQKTEWFEKATKALGGNCGTSNIRDILKQEAYSGAEPEDILATLIAQFGIKEVVNYAKTQISTTKKWWGFADYLEGTPYKEVSDYYEQTCN